jgi:hypothetical protein
LINLVVAHQPQIPVIRSARKQGLSARHDDGTGASRIGALWLETQVPIRRREV